MVAVLPTPLASSARSGITWAAGATPVAPIPFSGAAIVPATCVPWPLPSLGVASPSTKSRPATSCRSGWSSWAPVSTTPTVTPRPRVRLHATVASMSASDVPVVPITVWPVFSRPHSEANHGSRAAAWRSRFGSAQTTSASARRSASASARSPGAADTTSTSLSGRVRSNRTSAPERTSARSAALRPASRFTMISSDVAADAMAGSAAAHRAAAMRAVNRRAREFGMGECPRQRTVIWCIAAASVWTGVRPRRPAGPARGPAVRRAVTPSGASAPAGSARRVGPGRLRVVALRAHLERERAARILAGREPLEGGGEVVARRPAEVAARARR